MNSLSFSFDPETLEIQALQEKYDGRRLLRTLEAELRRSTGYPQITARFIKELFAESSITVECDERSGYVVSYYPFNLMDPKHDSECRQYAHDWIANHAKAQNVKPGLPPLHGTVVRVVDTVNLDIKKNRYHSLANDGGEFIAFYQEHGSEKCFMLRNIFGVGVVHVEFRDSRALAEAEEMTRQDCTEFRFLDGHGGGIDRQISDFIRRHQL